MKNLDISQLVLIGSVVLLFLVMLIRTSIEAWRNRKTPAHKAALRRQRQIRREMLAKQEEQIAQEMEERLKKSRRQEQVAPPPVTRPPDSHELLREIHRQVLEAGIRRMSQRRSTEEVGRRFKPGNS